MRYILLLFCLWPTLLQAQSVPPFYGAGLLDKEISVENLNDFSDAVKHYVRRSPDTAKFFVDKMLNVNGAERAITISGYRWLGEYYEQKSQLDSAQYSFNEMLRMAEEVGIDSLKASALYQLGSSNVYQGKIPEAQEFLQRALGIYESINHRIGVENATYTLAVVYMYQENYETAINTYLKLDTLIKTAPVVDTVFLGSIAHNIGYLYWQIKNIDKANQYTLQAIEYYSQSNSQSDVMRSKSLLAWLKLEEEKYEEALQDFVQLKEYHQQTQSEYYVAESNMGIGKSYLGLKRYEESINFLLEAESTNRRIESILNLNTVLGMLGVAHQKTGDYERSKSYFLESSKLSTENNSLPLKIDAVQGLAEVYTEIGQPDQSVDFYDQLLTLKDSLNKTQNQKSVEDLETKYQTQKKEKEIELLSTQNALAEQQSRSQFFIFIATTLLITLVAVFFYVLYRNRQETTIKLKELDKVKSNFFANISHEFRTPLTLIKSPVDTQLANGNLQPEDRVQYESISRNADRLLSLVDQLLDLSRLESGSMKLNVEQASLGSFLEGSLASFEYVAMQKNINYQRDFNCANGEQWFDKDVVEKIALNLVSNAFKYTPDVGEVSCKLECTANMAVVSVHNTGATIDQEKLEKLFERFYQADSSKDGVGIGLALVKELTALHHGTINFISKAGHTEFSVEIPINRSAYKIEELRTVPVTTKNDLTTKTAIENKTIEDPTILSDNPIMLVVEDNSEVRKLVVDLFKNLYTVIESENGEEGIAKAIQYIPDIIISDVMMPKKDGIELSETLKTDERTSHIPIILLTAKAGEENTITGLETGADDYVVKPFSNEVLKVRVNKLTELRAQLRQRYSQEIVLRPKDIAVTSADEKFLERLQELLDERLTEPDFNAEVFSKAIGMSRMQLHRKLKALVGLTTTEFIRSQRLKLAAHLLESAEINMSEVGYSVGFNDPSYFAKCFKEVYDCTPKQYAASNKASS